MAKKNGNPPAAEEQAATPATPVFDREAFWSVGPGKTWALPWPEIVGVSGPISSGKTTVAKNVGVPYELVANIDMEKSSTSAAMVNDFGLYLDVQAKMAEQHPEGYQPKHFYEFIMKAMNEIPTGKFDVGILDNASPLEAAITDYVITHPGQFGLTANQIANSSGLKWGAVKDYYSSLITRWASKFKMLFIITQLRVKFAGKEPAKDKRGQPIMEPKGLEPIDQLSSLALNMGIGTNGIPSAIVRKCRISRTVWVSDPLNPPADIPPSLLAELYGEPGPVVVPHLPPRLPKATWPAIRHYMRYPANFDALKPEEQIPPEEPVNEAELMYMRMIASENERAASEARLAEIEMRRSGAQQPNRQSAPPPTGGSNGYPHTIDGLLKLGLDIGISNDDTKAHLKEKFGTFSIARWTEYATSLKGLAEARAATKEEATETEAQ